MDKPEKKKKKAERSSQGPMVLWHGMTCRQLLRLAQYPPLIHWTSLHTVLSLPGFGVYNSVMGLAEKLCFGRKVRQVELPRDPLFVIGHWRSGTTLLHNLLAQDPQYTCPNMYQVIFPNHFLVTEKVITSLTSWMVPNKRPMDNVPAGWHMPQEEDIAMAILTCLSPYMLVAQPDRFELCRPFWDLALLSDAELREWKEAYTLFMQKVVYKTRKNLVLKSPANTLRIPILLEMFPEARFVYIQRNPFDVYNSTIHMRKTMFYENCMGKPHLRDQSENIFWLQEFLFRTYERDKQLIPPGRLYEMKFEDLEQDPLAGIESTYRELGLSNWDTVKAILEPQMPALKKYKKNTFQYDRALMDEVYDRLKFIFDHYGYPHPAEQFETAAA